MSRLSVSLPSLSRKIAVTAFILAVWAVGFALIGFDGIAAAQSISLATPRQNVLFPSTAVGSTSAPVVVPLQVNSGGATITSISVSPSAGGAQEYTVQSIGCALYTLLPAGTSCNVSVTFTPGSPGNRTAPLQVQTSDDNFNFGMEGIGLGPQVALTPAVINTVAGNGSQTLTGDGGPAQNAGAPIPIATAIDSAGNLYIADVLDAVIRKVAASTGIISTIAGSNGNPGFSGDSGPAVNAQLNGPSSVAVDSAGNLYIADSGNQFIRKIAMATGTITTVVGTGRFIGKPPVPPTGYRGDGYVAAGAWLNSPGGIAFDDADDLYIADTGNNVIRRVDAATDIITTVAGDAKAGPSGDGGPATSAELNQPEGVAVDISGNLYIADHLNNVIRKVAAGTGIITTVAGNGTAGFSGDGGPGTSAELHYPSAVSVDSAGDLYIVDANNHRIREVSANSGIIATIAGTGTAGFAGDNGSATNAELKYPNQVTLDSLGNLYVADSLNNRIREINVLDSQLNFAPTPIGFSSLDSPQTATVTNIGNAPLLFSVPMSGLNPSISPNFGLSNSSTCPQLDISSSSEALASGSSCSLLLSFTPIQTGPISGTANIADNAISTPPFVQTVHLNAVGLPASAGRPDFSLSVTPSNQTISTNTPSAAYTVTVNSIYNFSGNVALTATGLPANVSATFAPTTVAVTGTSATSTFTVTLTSTHANSTPGNSFPGESSALRYGLLLLGVPLLELERRRKHLRSVRGSVRGKALFILLAVATLAIAATSLTGCANIGLELQPQAYNITINGVSSNLQRSTALSLTVDQYTKVKYR